MDRKKLQTHGDSFEDGGHYFAIVEAEGQRLQVRVGPVFHDKKKRGFDKNGQHPVQGIWLDMTGQNVNGEYGDSLMLISGTTFDALVTHVRRRLKNARRRKLVAKVLKKI